MNSIKKFLFEYHTGDCSYTSILLDKIHNCLICGTSSGSVRVHLWPPVLQDEDILNFRRTHKVNFLEFYEVKIHLYPINNLALTPLGDQLISTSTNGLVFISKVENRENFSGSKLADPLIREEKEPFSTFVNELFFVKKKFLRQQNRIIKDKQLEVARFQKSLITGRETKRREYRSRLMRMTDSYELNIKNSQIQRDEFDRKNNEQLIKKNDRIDQLKQEIMQKRGEMNEKTAKIVNYEKRRNEKLREQLEKTKSEKKQQREQVKKSQTETLSELKEAYDNKLKELNSRYSSIKHSHKNFGEEFLRKIELEEEEHEREIISVSRRKDEEIKRQREENQELKIAQKDLNKEYTEGQRKDHELQKKFENLVINNTSLLEKKVKRCIELLKLQEQLLEREQVVFSKEETIKAAKDEEINLENFKYMLEQKISSLTSEKEQLVSEIESREKVLRDMFSELIKQSKTNTELSDKIKKLQKGLEIMEKIKKQTELKIYIWNNKIINYTRKISSLLNNNPSKSELAILINTLIDSNKLTQIEKEMEKFEDDESLLKLTGTDGEFGTNVHEELINQNKWLIKKLYMVNQAAKGIAAIRSENIETGLNQNKRLIEECNSLIVDNEYLNKKFREMQQKVMEAENNNERTKQENSNQKLRSRKYNLAQNEVVKKIVEKNPQGLSYSGKKGKKAVKGIVLPIIHN